MLYVFVPVDTGRWLQSIVSYHPRWKVSYVNSFYDEIKLATICNASLNRNFIPEACRACRTCVSLPTGTNINTLNT